MSEAYNDGLNDQLKSNVFQTLRQEAANLSHVQKGQLAADIAGIFDPTPTSDAIGGILSLVQGDFVGAGLSVVGMVPYIGDAGKVGKIARIAPRTGRALETMFRSADNLARGGRAALQNAGLTLEQVAAARREAARRALNTVKVSRTSTTTSLVISTISGT